MKLKFKMSIFWTILGMGLGFNSLHTFAQKKDLVKNANEAFLAGKYAKAISRIKEILIDGDNMEKEEAFMLLNTMYKQTPNEISPSWKLPSNEIENLRIAVQTVNKNISNNDKPDLRYFIKVSGFLNKDTEIENFQLKYLFKNSKETLIDLKQQKGEFYGQGTKEFSFKTLKSDQFYKSGVYRFEFHFKKNSKNEAKIFSGWIIIDPQMVCDALPKIGDVSAQSIKWSGYKTANNNSYDIKSILVTLKTKGINDDVDVWENRYSDMSTSKAQVELKNQVLGKGEYKTTVNFRERRHFGSIEIGRECVSSKTFTLAE